MPHAEKHRPRTPRLTSLAPQLLVDDLGRSIAYYERLGFTFGEPWQGFYAIGTRDGLELHPDCAREPAQQEVLDQFLAELGRRESWGQCSSGSMWRD